MVMDIFETLLVEFAQAANLGELKPDGNNSCLIALPNKGPKIQLELDTTGDYLIIGSEVGQAPPGRYRETLFKTALLCNALPYPRYGTFAFSQRADQIVLFDKIPVKDLNGVKIADIFAPFSEKAALWKDALSKGEVPAVSGSYSTKKVGTGMFGL